jgi:hypothetical protein
LSDTLHDLDDLPTAAIDPLDDIDEGPVRKKAKRVRKKQHTGRAVLDVPPPPRGGHYGRSHRLRHKKREVRVEAEGHQPRAAAYAKHAAGATHIQTALQPEQDLLVEHGAYRAGMPSDKELRGGKKARGLEEFLRMGFRRISWNGMCVIIH